VIPDRNLALELVRVTETAALAAAPTPKKINYLNPLGLLLLSCSTRCIFIYLLDKQCPEGYALLWTTNIKFAVT
jgi:hypothetical protein